MKTAFTLALFVFSCACGNSSAKSPAGENTALPATTEAPAATPPAVAKLGTVQAAAAVKPVDPFAALPGPKAAVLGENDPRADKLRLGPKVPPEKGEVQEPFPPAGEIAPPKKAAPVPLEVIRHSPDGEIGLADAVTVTFNQPMVPLETLLELDREASPLVLSPLPEGRFVWLGSDTVAFQAKDRLPFATDYKVQVKAGTKSAFGQPLARDFTWTFSTPALQVVSAEPYDGSNGITTDAKLRLAFNAAVDPKEVLRRTMLVEDGRKAPLALEAEAVPPPEATGDPVYDEEQKKALARNVVLKPKELLKPATGYSVTVGKELRSTEGPKPLGNDFAVHFETYQPLKVVKISCNWQDEPCYPGSPVTIEYNNPLKRIKGVAEFIKVTPAVEDLRVRMEDRYVTIYGDFQPSTDYTVVVAGGLADVYGQTDAKGEKALLKYSEAEPFLSLQRSGFGVLEAKEDPYLLLSTMNVGPVGYRLAVVPKSRFWEFAGERVNRHGWGEEGERDPLAGLEIAHKETLETGQLRNRVVQTRLNLKPGLGAGGAGVVFLDVTNRQAKKNPYQRNRELAMLVVTNLGLTVVKSFSELVVLVTTLDSGAPVADVDVTAFDCKGKALAQQGSGADGTVRLEAPGIALSMCYLTAKKGGDVSFLPSEGQASGYYYESSYRHQLYGSEGRDFQPRFSGFIFLDRGVYRPAEDISIDLVGRVIEPGPKGDVRPLKEEERACKATISDPRGAEVFKKDLQLSAFGTASFSYTSPKDASLGYYQIRIECPNGAAEQSFQIEEYRAPEYKTEVQLLSDGKPALVKDLVKAKISGRYYFGSPMAGASVEWRLRRSSSSYTPPGNDGFSFGTSEHSWLRLGYSYDAGNELAASGSGVLGGDGELALELALDPGKLEDAPVSFELEAEVYSPSRQSIAGRASILAHRSARCVGLRLDRSVVEAGETAEVQAVVTALDGTRQENVSTTVELFKVTWDSEESLDSNGEPTWEYKEHRSKIGACSVVPGQTPGNCRMTVPSAGSYVVSATVSDEAGRPYRTELQLYAAGEGAGAWSSNSDNLIELVPDKKEYLPGDEAKILVRSVFKEATGLVSVSREGLVSVEPVSVRNGNAMVRIPILEHQMPSLAVSVVLVRGRTEAAGKTRDDRGRPSFASADVELPISREARRIGLSLELPEKTVEPGSVLKLAVTAKDAAGKPAKSSLAIMVVDEGVLSLTSFTTPNPLVAMYQGRAEGTATTDTRPLVVPRSIPKVQLEPPRQRVMMKSAMMAPPAPAAAAMAMEEAQYVNMAKAEAAMDMAVGGMGNGEAQPQFMLRDVFKSTAWFNGDLVTGDDGRLSVEIPMPHNLTEFRVMVVAADSTNRFGAADAQVAVRKKLMIRPALPRFANFGDRFQASAVINNETGAAVDVMVRLLAVNLKLEGENVRTVRVDKGGALEVQFPVSTLQPGPATVQFAAIAMTEGRPTDATELTIPVLIPATSEAFATYGTTEDVAIQPIRAPKDAIPEFGGLDVSLSSTALTGLQDAVKYLLDYPYECTEQICSRILPIMALGDIIRDFKLGKTDTEAQAKELVEAGLKKLLLHQRSDGGFGYWTDSKMSWLHVSAWAVLTMDTARKHGFKIDADALERALSFLQYRLDQPYEWEAQMWDTQILAAMVLTRLGRAPQEHLNRLYGLATGQGKGSDAVSLYAKAWLMEALFTVDLKDPRVEELHRQLSNAAVEKASSIHFSEQARESLKLMFHSEDRSDAIILASLLTTHPQEQMIPKIVRGLMRARVNGAWSTTQANAWALLAVGQYYRLYEKAEPSFEATLWLDRIPVLGKAFKGRSMAIVKTRVPMKALLADEVEKLVLGKTGKGRLYYRLELKYAPRNLRLEAEDRGISVERLYLPEEDGAKLERNDDGALVVKAGTNVRVKLRVIVPDRRYYVAVVDPLPAGLEAVNQVFDTTAKTRKASAGSSSWPSSGWWYWNPWDFMEMRDDRVQLFADSMYAGVYEYTYLARATTPGDFVIPPARAEEMYEPETFGRTASDRMTVQ